MSNRNQQIPSRKKQSAGTSISSSPVRCNNRHRGDRSHMDGETCVSCINVNNRYFLVIYLLIIFCSPCSFMAQK